jgi:hypothetical protein
MPSAATEWLTILGCSGQNINDISRYGDMAESIDWLEQSLKWRHIAPTAPDTLACYPYEDDDAFSKTATAVLVDVLDPELKATPITFGVQ